MTLSAWGREGSLLPRSARPHDSGSRHQSSLLFGARCMPDVAQSAPVPYYSNGNGEPMTQALLFSPEKKLRLRKAREFAQDTRVR